MPVRELGVTSPGDRVGLFSRGFAGSGDGTRRLSAAGRSGALRPPTPAG
ncbi:protein of unassigned function [Methylobacterium oryzae CBMB20]|uniref:Protein of unassigned function n=1 Tax=Methylobacterium oryzae CBMB20 TaxID=693986 RepID=A0A089NTR4_9HYPH|nr:protein of unassigned function [Methylobacterium oryzae CBMB20]